MRYAVCFLLLVTSFFLAGFSAPRLLDRPYAPLQSATVGELRLWQAAQQPPPVSAQAYLLYDFDADKILLAENAQEARAPASLTKLMTALLIFEQDELTRTVTVAEADHVGGATMGLVTGERLTVEQLLWGLLLPSGNDAAMTLARTESGSMDAFVTRMNGRASELGLVQSYFVNPHGLDASGHQSSAADLLVITRLLWRFPLFRKMVATSEITVAGHRLENTNELLLTFPGTVGVKTGTSVAAGQCLVAAFEQAGRQVLLIVLGSRDRYADARALYHYYQTNYRWLVPNVTELGLLNRLIAPDGVLWYLRPVGAAPAQLVRLRESNQLRAFRRLNLPATGQVWSPGLEVGVVEWRMGNSLVGVQTLVLW